jgi:hypothetical protein
MGNQPVYVRPITGVGVDAANGKVLQGIGSAEELTQLMRHSLRLHALPVIADEAQAAYTLACEIGHLGYSPVEGKEETVRYEARLVCQLYDRQRQLAVWERTLDRDYAHRELFSSMGNLPENPYKHERRLFQYCVVPLWDAMSGSVWAVFEAQEPPPTQAAAEERE